MPGKIRVPSDAILESRLMSPETWPDFERMFQKHNGCAGGCWCTFHILPSGEYNRTEREARKALHEGLVCEGRTRGVVCYYEGVPVGWCQFGPADVFRQIERSKVYAASTKEEGVRPVWRITCVFVDKDYRGNGLSQKVLSAGVDAIRALGGGTTEAFPFETTEGQRPAYTGSAAMYEREGFSRVAPLGKSRTLMRAEL